MSKLDNEKLKPQNLFCVGRNYINHAIELANSVPKEPMIFMKPTHSVVYTDGSEIAFPSNEGDIHYEIELVLYIGKEVTDNFLADDIVTKMALGIDFTLRDVQTKLKSKGHPWLRAKGIRNSALLTSFWDFPGTEMCEQNQFTLICNNKIVQQGQADAMVFDFQTLLEYIHEHYGLGVGDMIYTGTPAGVGSIKADDKLELYWGDSLKGSFIVKM